MTPHTISILTTRMFIITITTITIAMVVERKGNTTKAAIQVHMNRGGAMSLNEPSRRMGKGQALRQILAEAMV